MDVPVFNELSKEHDFSHLNHHKRVRLLQSRKIKPEKKGIIISSLLSSLNKQDDTLQ